MESPYKIKHWSPVRRVPKSVDGWWNVLEYEDIEADEYGDTESLEMKSNKNSGGEILRNFLFFKIFCVSVESETTRSSPPHLKLQVEPPPGSN